MARCNGDDGTADTQVAQLKAFPPIASNDAEVLILGSMPSVTSLSVQRYYAHPRNHFWMIMDALFGIDKNLCYAQRCRILIGYRIALWDVIDGCRRHGSLDADILEKSIKTNNFNAFFKHHSAIHSVFFNGTKAEQIYGKYVLPTLSANIKLNYTRLPSTSPANATFSLAEKLKAWRLIKQNVKQSVL
ncbi:MAG: DNA-deoxyinosine glycosylase [Chromatiales bacterium]|nr:DNA-deoxyinosine glycosylase [Chromatiales bacterium]